MLQTNFKWKLPCLFPLPLWVTSSQVSFSKHFNFIWVWREENLNVCTFDSVMVHCRERGDEMIVGDLSHMHIYEQGGSAQVSSTPGRLHLFPPHLWCFQQVHLLMQIAGVHSAVATTLHDGTFDLDELESQVRHSYPKPHFPRSRLISVENTHNVGGGRALPLTFLQKVHQ